ncbi:restriction endonuclease subunit S [Sulfurospirillum barnesii]|uniref:Type I restriction modification DNA specificity protein n=1 Tax=Sulfurospirillum barnesii (strain ATCC 700032 / DSM 10660 / SES-3) TaxID=760154 RepID=I3Y025_SULBS|nr:restriction endonuclease subunit S [Sulfurospirillum barnesii]AFL69549.1 type I restriction modification DNA specificity protein [Sulfurospirillum barnesii SES-3]
MFEVKTVKSFDEGKLILTEQKQTDYIEFVGRTRNNNGIKGYLQKLEIEPNPKNVISVSQIGTIVAQIRQEEWYASQNIFSLTQKNTYQNLISLYSVAVINKSLCETFSDGYGNYPTLDKLKNLKIQLPIKNGKIDFDFMENFIAELEAERLAELEAYLLATGLIDTTLTHKEQKVLEDFKQGKVEFGTFTYESIFNKIVQGRRLKKDDQISGNIPFVMAGTTNTGVVNYISNPVARFPKNSITIDIFGNTFYRNYDFGAGDDTGVYWNNKREYSKETMLFFTASMEKSIRGKFSFGKKLRSSQSLSFKMTLPTQNHQPDYETINTFISAIQKLVIKDVVTYADRKIAATKHVIA